MGTAVIHILALGIFLVAGALLPRRDDGLLHRDTVVNVVTGGSLAAIRFVLLAGVVTALGPGLLPFDDLPLPAQVVIGFLVLDATRWALHLVHHRVPFFWQFHRVHHSSVRLNATSGLRMHVVDFVQLAFLPALLFSVLLDTSGSPVWLVPALLVPGVIFDAFEHANLRFDANHGLGRLWDRVFNNPHFHAWHHTADGDLCDGNYGNVLTIWDRLFGTCVSRPDLPEAFGLSGTERLRDDPIGLQLLRRR